MNIEQATARIEELEELRVEDQRKLRAAFSAMSAILPEVASEYPVKMPPTGLLRRPPKVDFDEVLRMQQYWRAKCHWIFEELKKALEVEEELAFAQRLTVAVRAGKGDEELLRLFPELDGNEGLWNAVRQERAGG